MRASVHRLSDVRVAGEQESLENAWRARILGRPGWAFAALTLLYVLTCLYLSSVKLLWLDELITLQLARARSVSDIWAMLAAGADPNPPVTHILVHASRSLLGEHAYALRLPAMCGYWLGMLALFLYLRRRLPYDWALAGTVLSMTMAAFDYSFESRSYALFYGFTMLAFYCWTLSADENLGKGKRNAATAGMMLTLVACISTNYFAVLAFLPVAAGEVVRTCRSFTADHTRGTFARILAASNPWFWLAWLSAASTLLIYRTFIARAITQFAPYAWNKVSPVTTVNSYFEIVEATLFLLLALFAFYGVARAGKSFRPGILTALAERLSGTPALLPLHETVGVAFLMAYPVLGYTLASIRGGMLSPRFVMPVCFGFAISGTVAAYRLFGRLPKAGLTVLFFCLAWFLARETYVAYTYVQQKRSFESVLHTIPQAAAYLPSDAPIAVPDPLMALTLQQYAPADVASRLVFPVDFPAIRASRKEDSAEQNIWALRETLSPLRVEPLATLQQQTERYLIIAYGGNWLLQDLDRHGYDEHHLPIEPHADAIGGFTPLMHGLPAYYVGTGAISRLGEGASHRQVIPFQAESNLPNGSNSR